MKTKVFLFILSLSFLCWACNKSPKCWGDNENKGIIVQSVILGSCLADLDEKTFVIDSQNVLDSLYFITEQNGHTCSKPTVDFSENTILAQYASGQCEIKIIREVNSDELNKRYVYTVEVKECGTCKSEIFALNGVLTPKLPEGWTVMFVLK